MASSSPYQNNDYAALSTYRPYRLPINDIFKANVAIDAYWDQGAANIKNAYDNVLGLKLRSTDNKQVRDQFIQDSQKELTKVSAMNVADPSIQRQGRDIFSPIMKDENIVGEDYVVKNGLDELSTGQQSRTKDGGKNYNPLSVQNIQFEQNLLTTDVKQGGLNKRDGWKAIAQSQSKYTPFTDISKEMKQIEETLKATEMEEAVQSGDQWRIYKTKTTGISKERMNAAIDAMGSPALKAQMSVEGRNVYYKKLASDPSRVDGYYQGLAQSYYTTKINEIKTTKGEVERELFMIPKKSEDVATSEQNARNKEILETQIKDLDKVITKMETVDMPGYISEFRGLGNPSNLSSHLGKIEQLWQQSSIDNLAGNLSYQSITRSIVSDPAKIAQEGLRLKYAELQQEINRDAETKRNNMANNIINATKKTEGADGDEAKENPVSPLWEATDGTLDTPLPNDPNNTSTTETNAQKAIDYFEKGEESLREASIKGILGEHGWGRIQSNIASDAPLASALLPDELVKSSKMIKLFAESHPDAKIFGIGLPTNLTDQQYQEYVGKMSTGNFKKLVGMMSTQDSEFTAELIGKSHGENGPKLAGQWRATVNKNRRDNLNLSEVIGKKVAVALQDYAPFFKNGGNTNITEESIRSAFAKANENRDLFKYERISLVENKNKGTYTTKKEKISREDYNELKKQGASDFGNKAPSKDKFVVNRSLDPLSYDNFRSEVKKRTNYIYSNVVTESNQKETPIVYPSGPKADPMKVMDMTKFKANRVQGSSSDGAVTDEDMDWMIANSKRLQGVSVIHKGIGEQHPKMRFQFESGWATGDDAKKVEERINRINKSAYPVTGALSNFSNSSNENGYIRTDGAKIVTAPFRSATKKGGTGLIEIYNDSHSPAVISPKVTISGELKKLYRKTDGSVDMINYTEAMLERTFMSDRYNPKGLTFEQYLQADDGPDKLNEWFARWITELEVNNNKFK